jgi:hypothetical protein
MSAEMGCMGSPTMARVPALVTWKPPGTTWLSPACSSRSATGERQMLPVQTVRILTGADVSKEISLFPAGARTVQPVHFNLTRPAPTPPHILRLNPGRSIIFRSRTKDALSPFAAFSRILSHYQSMCHPSTMEYAEKGTMT